MTTKFSLLSESLHARIPKKVMEELDLLASTLGRSRNWVFNEAIKQFLEINQWQSELIKTRLRESEKAKAQFILHDKIMKQKENRLRKKLKI